MRLSDRMKTVMALETRRAANTTRRKIGSGVPEGPGGAPRPRCGAVAGMSVHAPMT
jgi:hypothetical protein